MSHKCQHQTYQQIPNEAPSLRQTRFAQRLFVPGKIIETRSAVYIPHVRNTKCRIELAQARDCSLGVLLVPGHGAACREYANRWQKVRLFPSGPLRPGKCLLVATCCKMRQGNAAPREEGEGIERTEPHG